MKAVRRGGDKSEETSAKPAQPTLTPFAQLAKQSAEENSAKSRRSKPFVQPTDLLDAPAYALAPMTHLGPMFIASCLQSSNDAEE